MRLILKSTCRSMWAWAHLANNVNVWMTYKINVTQILVYMKLRGLNLESIREQLKNFHKFENLGHSDLGDYFCVLRSSIKAHLCEIWWLIIQAREAITEKKKNCFHLKNIVWLSISYAYPSGMCTKYEVSMINPAARDDVSWW